jgi:GTP diphosphokinase / guanosine-3',5'-bis(diphosphate) 3'-diphosphatase
MLVRRFDSTLVVEATNGRDSELVAAALLHNAIEDQERSHLVIAEAFGPSVATPGAEITIKLEEHERKGLRIQPLTRRCSGKKFQNYRSDK